MTDQVVAAAVELLRTMVGPVVGGLEMRSALLILAAELEVGNLAFTWEDVDVGNAFQNQTDESEPGENLVNWTFCLVNNQPATSTGDLEIRVSSHVDQVQTWLWENLILTLTPIGTGTEVIGEYEPIEEPEPGDDYIIAFRNLPHGLYKLTYKFKPRVRVPAM